MRCFLWLRCCRASTNPRGTKPSTLCWQLKPRRADERKDDDIEAAVAAEAEEGAEEGAEGED